MTCKRCIEGLRFLYAGFRAHRVGWRLDFVIHINRCSACSKPTVWDGDKACKTIAISKVVF